MWPVYNFEFEIPDINQIKNCLYDTFGNRVQLFLYENQFYVITTILQSLTFFSCLASSTLRVFFFFFDYSSKLSKF